MRKLSVVITLCCVASFPILFLYANNVEQIEFFPVGRSLILSLIAVFSIYSLVWIITRDVDRSVLSTTILAFLFYSYGHVYAQIKSMTLLGVAIGRHRFLSPLWLILLLGGLCFILRVVRDPARITRSLLPVSILLFSIPIASILIFQIRGLISKPVKPPAATSQDAGNPKGLNGGDLPDIYYIIMDGYPGKFTLEEVFQYDNEPFFQKLEEMGFYIARCSQSNYAKTELSLASSLNMAYLQDLGSGTDPESTDRFPLRELIKHNAVHQILTDLGYRTITFDTGYYWSNIKDADLFLRPSTSTMEKLSFQGGLNSFELMVARSSLGLLFVDGMMAVPSFLEVDFSHPDQIHRERTLFTLNELKTIPTYPAPKFIFAHIITPRYPIVFDEDGSLVENSAEINEGAEFELREEAYRNQLDYVNSELLTIVADILEKSHRPPIIIIQGDHGPDAKYFAGEKKYRMHILNAYYIPDDMDSEQLYPHISPVNSFRLLFNALLNKSYPLLEDSSYFSKIEQPFLYSIVENHCEIEAPSE